MQAILTLEDPVLRWLVAYADVFVDNRAKPTSFRTTRKPIFIDFDLSDITLIQAVSSIEIRPIGPKFRQWIHQID